MEFTGIFVKKWKEMSDPLSHFWLSSSIYHYAFVVFCLSLCVTKYMLEQVDGYKLRIVTVYLITVVNVAELLIKFYSYNW